MATFVFTNGYVMLNSVDLSDHVRSVTVTFESELQDSTTMGDTTRERTGGLLNWTMDIEFLQDFAAGKVDATLFPLVGGTFVAAVRAVNGAISATNPEYTGTGILESYPVLGNAIGEMAVTRVRILSAGALTRDTTP